MAVFVAGLDETTGKTHRDSYMLGGFVAPEDDWSSFFAPAWQERVLDGPPEIPYLHMTDIRSSQWRAEHRISKLDANDRIDEAIRLIDTMHSLFPIGIRVNAGVLRDRFSETRVLRSKGKARPFEPDYLCFLAYSWVVLNYVHLQHPDAEKVDFIVERNGEITKHIQDFHSTLSQALTGFGEADLAPLVGELLPGGKDRVPLQAADVLCWHSARAQQPETMDKDDIRRYSVIAHREGVRQQISDEQIAQMADALGV
jgi:hypothetical protein